MHLTIVSIPEFSPIFGTFLFDSLLNTDNLLLIRQIILGQSLHVLYAEELDMVFIFFPKVLSYFLSCICSVKICTSNAVSFSNSKKKLLETWNNANDKNYLTVECVKKLISNHTIF